MSMRLASVVLLPEPVGPVTSTRPRGRYANWWPEGLLGRGAVHRSDRALQLAAVRYRGDDFIAGGATNGGDRDVVSRFGERNHQTRTVEVDRERVVLVRNLRRDQRGRVVVDRR